MIRETPKPGEIIDSIAVIVFLATVLYVLTEILIECGRMVP